MTSHFYKTKPVTIEATLYTGDEENIRYLDSWSNGKVRKNKDGDVICESLQGNIVANIGDYIIYNDKENEYYPCNGEVFNRKYEISQTHEVLRTL